MNNSLQMLAALTLGLVACDNDAGNRVSTMLPPVWIPVVASSPTPTLAPTGRPLTRVPGVVQVVLYTHVEDVTPTGTLGTQANRDAYLLLRGKLIEMAELVRVYSLQWVFQPDWKILEAAGLYENDETTADTEGMNFLVYLRDVLDVVIDPHSHENFGHNYADVAFLLESLGVGGSKVIGGHIWDPSLPQFQEWDRFRDPIVGEKYPEALWRGDILIGAGSPGHVNDPLVSGLWRPQDHDNFFTHDPQGNIVAVGGWHDEVDGVTELVELYENGTVPANVLLTSSWNITPHTITPEGGLAHIEESIFIPLASLRDDGRIAVTDFASLVAKWQSDFAGEAFLYAP